MSNPIRVFIVDDSVLVRYALGQLLQPEPDILVVGDAAASRDLVTQISQAGPDLLIVDIPLPREKGIRDLRDLHRFHLPVVVFTRTDTEIARDLIPLLEAGAVGFVLKPDQDENVADVREQLLHEIRLNGRSHHAQLAPPTAKALSYLDPLRVVAIGSSTGGPEALAAIMPQFPANFPAGIVIVQHMPPDFTARFAARLNNLSHVTVKEAAEGDTVRSGLALLAPGDYHMVFTPAQEDRRRLAKVHLTKDPPQWKLRPTVDKMMTSLAPIYATQMIGVILTGMGEDGVVGMRALKQLGGHTLVQNEATSAVFGMGQEVIKNNLADEVLPLNRIVPRILEMLHVR